MTDEPDRDSAVLRKPGALPPPEAPAGPRRARAKRWLPRAIGGAAAACAIGALLAHVIALSHRTPDTPPHSDRPARAVKVVTGSVEIRLATDSDAPAQSVPAARKPAKPAPRIARKRMEPVVAPSESVPIEAEAAPQFAIESSPPVAPVEKPSERAMIGPADPRGVVGPMPRSGPAPGFGISGSGAAMPGPAPRP